MPRMLCVQIESELGPDDLGLSEGISWNGGLENGKLTFPDSHAPFL